MGKLPTVLRVVPGGAPRLAPSVAVPPTGAGPRDPFEFGPFLLHVEVALDGLFHHYVATTQAATETMPQGRVVLVRVARADLGGDSARRIAAEARIDAKFEHPVLIRNFEVGFIDGILYDASEWVGGVSLWSLMQAVRGVPASVASHIVQRLAQTRAFSDEIADATVKARRLGYCPLDVRISFGGHIKTDAGAAWFARRLASSATSVFDQTGRANCAR